MSADRTVVVWRSALLSGSETFVRQHGAHLTRWRPVYLGAAKVASALAEETDVVVFPGSFWTLRLTGWSPRLRRALRAQRPALVHAHFGGDGWLVSRAASGVPLVVTVHGHDVSRQPAAPGLRGLRYRRNLRAVFRRATVILAVSGAIRDRAVAWGADPAKVRVHHTGVPLPAAVPDVPKQWDVVFVGRFVAKKGVDDLVEALGPARALFIGSGPLLDRVRDRARELGVDATFAGQLDPAAVARHVAAARILAAPSKTAADGDAEGLPTTILEAAALGVPAVATRHSGIPEAVVDGVTGLLGAEGDRVALAANIARLLADDELRSALGRQARAHVETNFDLVRQTAALEDLYDALATGPAAAPGGPASRSPRTSPPPGPSASRSASGPAAGSA
ncbi:glycosyltransferase [Jidongwangia harbinensis]|uniref:glycosyltransferase n=1 Tax=Jidongwangia harbinensis TaxID=2878561 RepID=UPI001CDA454B|nr:glycosyltransferase [Jidongwangia harbinensis]MCA2214000.1 glycosyltransferase [Jidongwangia harbinensis]